MNDQRRHRGAGEGSIVKRKDGRWSAIISLGWEGGKRKRRTIYGETRAQVAAGLNKALRDARLGLPVAPERQKMAAYLNRWLIEAVKPTVRPLTFEQYAQHVRLYLIPAFGHLDLTRLEPEHIQTFINKQLERGLSPRTVQLSIVTLQRALKQAERWNLVARNVARLVDRPRVPKRKATPLDPEESRRLLSAARESRFGALYTTILLCGLRPGEALALSWQQIDFDRQTLTVERSLARVGRLTGASKLTLQETKTDESLRVLHLPELVLKALREHRRQQAALRLGAGPEWHDQGFVFTTAKGTPLELSNVHRDYKQVLARAGLPDKVRIHDLRHSAASLLLNLGVSLKVIQAVLGHSSIKVTADIYAHLAPKMQRDAVDELDKLFHEN